MSTLLTPPLVALLAMALAGLYGPRHRSVLAVLLLAVVTSALMSLLYGISNAFTSEGINSAVVFHLLHGLETKNDIGVAQFPELVALSLAVFAGLALWAWLAIRRSRARRQSPQPQQTPATRVSRILLISTTLAASAVAIPLHPALSQSIQLWRELRPHNSEILTTELKPIPAQVIETSGGRPFVLVYAESFESAFFDQSAFPDLAPELSALKFDSLSFTGIGEAPLTSWTIAGMVASQCGVPLAPIRYRNQDDPLLTPHFIPGSDCLGGVLKARGYRLDFVGGASLSFAGKGQFYRSHGFDEVIGEDEIGAIVGANFPRSKWGAYDNDVFKTALHRFRVLKRSDSPFGLVVLTTSTHPPEGFISPDCDIRYGDGHHPLLNAARCSDREIAGFIRQIESEGPDNLITIVASDHLQMGSAIGPMFDQMGLPRHNLLFIRGIGRTGEVERKATTLDTAPTLLSLLTSTPVESMALGRNLLDSAPTMSERYGRTEFYRMLQSWRTNFWKIHGAQHSQNHGAKSAPTASATEKNTSSGRKASDANKPLHL